MVPPVSLAPREPRAWLAPEAPMDSLDRRPLVSQESLEQKESRAYRAPRPVAFRPNRKVRRQTDQKSDRNVMPESLQSFRPGVVEAAAFPQNRWS